MKLAKGPRPWSVWTFGVLLFCYGAFNLIAGLSFLENQELLLQRQLPSMPWTRDLVIVWVSAQFTIVLIPIIAVCAFASRFAKFLTSIMALVSLPWLWSYLDTFLEYGIVGWVEVAQSLVVVIAAVLLYLPSATRWLKQEGPEYDAVFE